MTSAAVELPPYSTSVHQHDLWTFDDAARELGVRTELHSTYRYMGESLLQARGGTVDKLYVTDLEAINRAIGFQVDFNIVREDSDGLAHFFKDRSLLASIDEEIARRIESRRQAINDAISNIGTVGLSIAETDTLEVDLAKRERQIDGDLLEGDPEFDTSIYDHSGIRVAKLISLTELDEESRYGMIIEGRSGNRYNYAGDSMSGSITVLLNPSRLVLTPTEPAA